MLGCKLCWRSFLFLSVAEEATQLNEGYDHNVCQRMTAVTCAQSTCTRRLDARACDAHQL